MSWSGNFGIPTQSQVTALKGAAYQAAAGVNTEAVLARYVAEGKSSFGTRLLDPNQRTNPPFDPRIWAVPGGPSAPGMPKGRLLRGRMTMMHVDPTSIAGAPKLKRALNFLWNPQTISHGYSFDSSVLPAGFQNPDDVGQPIQNGQSVGWNLIFNRMYEVMENANHPGVLGDTQALEYMLGAWDGTAIRATQMLVVFGTTGDAKPFAYTGYITNANVEYTHFSHRMIPTIAAVSITLARRFFPNVVGGGVNTPASVNPNYVGQGGTQIPGGGSTVGTPS